MNKYRPYFSSLELSEIIECLKTHPIQSPLRIAIMRYLEGFAIKINNGILDKALEIKGTKTQQLVRALDLDNTEATNLGRRKQDKYDLYIRWMNNEILTIPQIELVMEYRYENDLMNPEEESAYESKLLKGVTQS